jgi:hypothetical protein
MDSGYVAVTNIAVASVQLVQHAPSLEDALRVAADCFPGISSAHAEQIYLNTLPLSYSEDGNTLYYATE